MEQLTFRAKQHFSSPQWVDLVRGQLTEDQPDAPAEHVWLSPVDDRQEISTFQANELGEFRCTFHLRRALKLMVHAGRQVVAIPIETLFHSSSDTGRSISTLKE
jgi:hypothetical protein